MTENETSRSYKTIADYLILEKNASDFIEACATMNILNMLGSMYYKKDSDRRIPFTVFVPKKLKLPKNPEEAFRLLRCHIVKNKFDEDSIQRMCENNKETLDKLTLPTMGGTSLEIACNDPNTLILPSGDTVKLTDNKLFKNGSVYFIKETLPIHFEDTDSHSLKEHLPSIVDVLYLENKPFVELCAKYDIVSMLCNKYFDKNRNQHSSYTVFAPKKITVKGKSDEEIVHILRSHIVKRPFDLEQIKKLCAIHQSNGITELTLSTMSTTKHTVSCEELTLNGLDLSTSRKVKNGILYMIPSVLEVSAEIPPLKKEEHMEGGAKKKNKVSNKVTKKVKKIVSDVPEVL